MPQNNSIESLYKRYLANYLNEEELADFLQRLHNAGDEETVSQLMDGTWKEMYEVPSRPGLQTPVIPIFRRKAFKWVAAASVIIIASFIFILSLSKNDNGGTPPVAKANDVQAPTNTQAVIVLADGSKVYLDSVSSGTVAQQGSTNVIKTADGKIVYNANSDQRSANSLVYNTLSNPRGSKVIDMQLSDGSHVWLNAGSSVKYPVAFIGDERTVEITGEAYFEVAHNASKPFHVKKGETDVTVLGTHFNVNAYDDEDALRVTLLEGSVKVNVIASAAKQAPALKGSLSSIVIKPGEQAVVSKSPNHQITKSPDVDLDQVMAWKNGLFSFDKTDIGRIMNDIARWYDVQVEYEGAKPQITLSGTVKRNLNVSKVLQMLELSGLKFKIEGKKIIVLK